MPNWCYNSVTMRHPDPAMITRAINAYREGRFLNEFIPMPQELLEGEGWYGWALSNWGTKWDIGDGEMLSQLDANTLVLNFDSAWSPPIEAYNRLVELDFDIEAKYYEPGMAFCGTYDSEYGENTYELGSLTADTVRDVIGKDLDDYFGISAEMRQYDESME